MLYELLYLIPAVWIVEFYVFQFATDYVVYLREFARKHPSRQFGAVHSIDISAYLLYSIFRYLKIIETRLILPCSILLKY